MAIQPLDEFKLVALMAAGALFALAGLYLLFRRQPEAEAARIELLGMKFQASSAGLLVFLIGAALVASPLLVPQSRMANPVPDQSATATPVERATSSSPQVRAVEVQKPENEDATSATAGSAQSQVNALVDGTENSFANAKVISLGSSASGKVSKGDIDVFTVSIPRGTVGTIVASAVVTAGGVSLTLLDGYGQTVGSDYAYDPKSASVSGKIHGEKYYVTVNAYAFERGEYLLMVGERPD